MANIEVIIKKNIELAPLTTFKIGGKARFFIQIGNKEDLADAVSWAEEKGMDIFILGGGSNILVSDNGFDGLVIKMDNHKVSTDGETIKAEAGAMLGMIVIESSRNSLSGFEWAIGIPGTVGGAVRGNAGAYGASFSDAICSAEAFDMETKRFIKMSKAECGFRYRHSVFKEKKGLLVWDVDLCLKKGDKAGILSAMEKNFHSRGVSQPKIPSVGCIFKNLLFEDISRDNPKLAAEAESEGVVRGGKIGTGWLINYLDLKGKAIGGAEVSSQHANFIVNKGGATAEDVITLISIIKTKARNELKIKLEEEVQLVGF